MVALTKCVVSSPEEASRYVLSVQHEDKVSLLRRASSAIRVNGGDVKSAFGYASGGRFHCWLEFTANADQVSIFRCRASLLLGTDDWRVHEVRTRRLYELALRTKDRNGLLADVCIALEALGCTVVQSSAQSTAGADPKQGDRQTRFNVQSLVEIPPNMSAEVLRVRLIERLRTMKIDLESIEVFQSDQKVQMPHSVMQG